MTGYTRVAMATSALALAAASAGPAFAQDADGESSSSARAAPAGEIVVTAQRRAEAISDVPASITALSGDAIEQAGITRFEDLGQVTPGLKIVRLGNQNQPSIRGISVLVVSTGNEPNVATYIDGFYQPNNLVYSQDLANISGVQVLKGPQGSLYGRNATGGVILVDTIEPGDEMKGSANIAVASRNDVRAKANVVVPIAEGLSFGASGYYRVNDGFLTNDTDYGSLSLIPSLPSGKNPLPKIGKNVGAFKSAAIRTKLKYEPSDAFKVVLGYNYLTVDNPLALAYMVYAKSPFGGNANYQRDHTQLTMAPVWSVDQNEYTALIEVQTGDTGTLSSHTSYMKNSTYVVFDFDARPFNAYLGRTNSYDKAFIQSLDYEWNASDNLNVLVGAQYLDIKSTSMGNSHIFLASGPILSSSFVRLRSKSWAAYADATIEAVPGLFLTGGVRYSSDKKSIHSEAPIGNTRVNGDQAKTFNSTTFRAVGRYELGGGMNVYASFSQGFKSGIYNTLGAPSSVSPEKINAYEIGWKFGRGPFNAAISAFHYDYKNLQVQSLVNGNGVRLTNAASAKIDGVEASLQAEIGENFSIRAGLSYLDSRYDSFPEASAVLITAAGLNNSTVNNLQNWSGLQMPRAPEWSGNLGATYNLRNVLGGRIETSADMSFSSSFYPSNNSYIPSASDPTNPKAGTPRYRENGYVLVNGQIMWHDESDHLSFGVFAENLTNTRFKAINAGSGYGDYVAYNTPRVIGARIGFSF